MTSRAFNFGAFERVIGTLLLTLIWSTAMVALLMVVSQHSEHTAELGRAFEIIANAGLVAIGLLFWGRPLFHGLRHVVNRLRRKYAESRGAA